MGLAKIEKHPQMDEARKLEKRRREPIYKNQGVFKFAETAVPLEGVQSIVRSQRFP